VKWPPGTPVEELDWIPPNRRTPLRRLGLHTLGDLVQHYPHRHEDRRQFSGWPDVVEGPPVCLHGVVLKTATQRYRGGRMVFSIVVRGGGRDGLLADQWTCRWFNSHYVRKMIAVDDELILYGRTKMIRGTGYMDHPDFEVLEEEGEDSLHFHRIVPVHPAGEGISAKVLRGLIHRALEVTDLEALPSLLPPQHAGNGRAQALRAVHFPADWPELEAARPHLILEEFFGLQVSLLARREQFRALPSAAKAGDGSLRCQLLERLPFSLTAEQERVLEEIRTDLAAAQPMQRLLQGDVGSGKTVVAVLAALQVIEAGWQAALMAPTQILAEQHHATISAWLEPLGLRVGLFTAARKGNDEPGENLFGEPEAGHLMIGTHALLYDGAPFTKLGLVIIDEQHKFGVRQRSRLVARGEAPDLLVMTATPIPRTLTQTLHGDLDVSLLREKPAARGRVLTAVRPPAKLPEITQFLHTEIAAGRQIFLVYPLVEESEKLTAKAATAEWKRWQERLAPHEVGLLHGKMNADEKEKIMREFRQGGFPALVATTVIEVGVDIPNATVMLVENAERFGLAQLHQLRGRVGRGAAKSWCVLVHSGDEDAAQKLRVLEQSNDGFVIAEADWNLRGPGDVLGVAQSGLPPLMIGDLRRDGELMSQARLWAREVFTQDPDLELPQHAAVRVYVEKRKAAEPVVPD
jgi:ATP-dependent DNA helicase RecG